LLNVEYKWNLSFSTGVGGVGLNSSFRGGGIYVEGLAIFSVIVLVMMGKVVLTTALWTWLHAAAWWLSLAHSHKHHHVHTTVYCLHFFLCFHFVCLYAILRSSFSTASFFSSTTGTK
jgi:hypothetical protein